MTYQGHCNCESIRITLPQQPPNTTVCHCDCCKRAGGGREYIKAEDSGMYILLTALAFSVNYFVSEDEMTVDDPNSVLKIYEDKKSASGNTAKRHFCSNCGSPLFTKTPKVPGKVFLKAVLFDNVSPPMTEVFVKKQYPWMTEVPTQTSGPRRPSDVVLRNIRPRNNNDLHPHEAHELQEIQTHEDNELDYSTPSASSGDGYRIVTRRTTTRALASRAETRQRRQARKGVWGKITRLWTHNVTLTVPQKSSRDYFALERTFLAYIRTSVAVTQHGVLIAQLFRLQAAEALADRLGLRKVGTSISITCYGVGILVALVGAYRFWRQQDAIAKGRIYAGGWELNSVGILLGCCIEADMNSFVFIRRVLGRRVGLEIQIFINPVLETSHHQHYSFAR
ncbi:uncharacterized protein N7500_009182 [Penicillium coprophilum]|uniref:uncharacterized protein n=1 Tax=Penicillium coprophilum TaxID=36646 RepID=UPI00239E3BAE|nr:uncharacterized protein N7500_009182 [Penicillium coprophilum]KAJ5153743.1 hypothetical protein N7500_009182 [Penicillium coprophilum]